ncbi:exo-alpha-sialidase [Streptomyces sp. ACA25]|uniref:F510_1955 family glycosylhydrolase n=1 Tax=Streptomyces sp. ACA25 TaxID=3022596 RepID=UPI002306ECFE|nr:exo-alpha-sialidase [Streptomyces sp. ACA25]MDB1088312.1 exo-alpha-sialidase [Streptomyces sp. ACA25]
MAPRTRTRTVSVSVAALLATALAACSGGSGPEASPDAGAEPDAGPTAEAAAVSHVHGLGIDPADDTLYVATHEGVLAVDEDGGWEVVSDEADYMGFAVAGPGHFLGSGHPAAGSDEPSNRGLLESTDAGRTWESRSLGGEADFHALEYAHGTVYGYDSVTGMLRVSEDHVQWQDRAQVPVVDIAIAPEDPDMVLGTTQEGVVTSLDGGETFGAGAQPVLMLLSWAEQDALYGVDPAGVVFRSPDGGAEWKEAGTVPGGRPQALAAVDADRLLVAGQDGVHESLDGGRTFTQRLALTAR